MLRDAVSCAIATATSSVVSFSFHTHMGKMIEQKIKHIKEAKNA